MTTNLLFLVSGLALPILLLPIEYVLPFPHFIEEIAKLLIILLLGGKQLKSNKLSLKTILLFSLSFTVSESVLYMMNLFALGQVYLFPIRLLLTGLLHSTTMIILFIGSKKSIGWKIAMLILSICLHYAYNEAVASAF